MSRSDERNYHADHRVRARERGDGSLGFIDEKRMIAIVTVPDEDGDGETQMELPIVYVVCPTCDGKGNHVNPSVDAGGISADDFYEDPDFAEAYMGGVYDVECYGCHGKRVVPQLNRDRIEPEILKLLDAHEERMRDLRIESEAERRMGC
jgi:hypothetical protein